MRHRTALPSISACSPCSIVYGTYGARSADCFGRSRRMVKIGCLVQGGISSGAWCTAGVCERGIDIKALYAHCVAHVRLSMAHVEREWPSTLVAHGTWSKMVCAHSTGAAPYEWTVYSWRLRTRHRPTLPSISACSPCLIVHGTYKAGVAKRIGRSRHMVKMVCAHSTGATALGEDGVQLAFANAASPDSAKHISV
jgi:hypothetical protein